MDVSYRVRFLLQLLKTRRPKIACLEQSEKCNSAPIMENLSVFLGRLFSTPSRCVFMKIGEVGEILFVFAMAVVLIAFRLESWKQRFGFGDDLTAKERAKVLLAISLGIGAVILVGVLTIKAFEG